MTNFIPLNSDDASKIPAWWSQAAGPAVALLKSTHGVYAGAEPWYVSTSERLICRTANWASAVDGEEDRAQLLHLAREMAEQAVAMHRNERVGIDPFEHPSYQCRSAEYAAWDVAKVAFLDLEARLTGQIEASPAVAREEAAKVERSTWWSRARGREARLLTPPVAKAFYAFDSFLGGTGAKPTAFWKAAALPTTAWDGFWGGLLPGIVRFLLKPLLLGWMANLVVSCMLMATTVLAKALSLPKEVGLRMSLRWNAAPVAGRAILLLSAPFQVATYCFVEALSHIPFLLKLAALPWWDAVCVPSFVVDPIPFEDLASGAKGHCLSRGTTEALRQLLPVWVVLSIPLLPVALLVRMAVTFAWGVEGIYQLAPFWLAVWLPLGLLWTPFDWIFGGHGIFHGHFGAFTPKDEHPLGFIRGVTAPFLR